MENQPYHDPAMLSRAPVVVAPSRKRRVMKWVLAVIGVLVALLLGLLILLLIGAELVNQGGVAGLVAVLTGLLVATLPVPIYVMLVLWLDRYEAEPLWLLGVAFLWGATIAAFAAFLINSIGGSIVTATAGAATGEAFGALISAPIVEESAKGLVLFIFFFWKKEEFDGVVDGVVYASMVALGFAMTENIKYYGEAALSGGETLTTLFIVRGTLSPFAHPLFTSMTGIGLGLSRQSNNKLVKYTAPIVGLIAAMVMHGLWNLSAILASVSPLIFIASYVLLMVPIFITAIVVVILGLRREGRIVRDYLACDLQAGNLSQAEYAQLCSVRGRMGSSFKALRTSGLSAWRARMKLHQLASELAFHRSRAARGFYTDDERARAREAEYIRDLEGLRRAASGNV
jgi:RsiW-degrading membrane proteinase PrsW (M82 family)